MFTLSRLAFRGPTILWTPIRKILEIGAALQPFLCMNRSPFVTPCEGIQDSLGFWIPRCRFFYLWVELGFRIPWAVFRIPKSRIPDCTNKNFPDSLTLGDFSSLSCEWSLQFNTSPLFSEAFSPYRTELPDGQSNGSPHWFWKLLKIYWLWLKATQFSTLFSMFIHCTSYSPNTSKSYEAMFMQEIFTRVVRMNGKQPNISARIA